MFGFHFDHLERCFNTQPPEGGWFPDIPEAAAVGVSTHSRLKAAGCLLFAHFIFRLVSTHSRLKAAGANPAYSFAQLPFQHTAA